MIFNDDLKHGLAYVWPLLAHPTFKRKIELIAVAINETDYVSSENTSNNLFLLSASGGSGIRTS
jgi:hypothetical protein